PAVYPLSLHDALPIFGVPPLGLFPAVGQLVAEPARSILSKPLGARLLHVQTLVHHFLVFGHAGPPIGSGESISGPAGAPRGPAGDRKSTRLNSSHVSI